MDRGNFRVESHVAQKSRRDKLRIQQNSDPNQHLEHTNTMEQLSVHQLLAPAKYESLSYDPNHFSAEMLSYLARNSQLLVPHNNDLVSNQESGWTQLDKPNGVSFAHLSHQIPPKEITGPQNSTSWKNCDYVVNYSNGTSTAVDQSNLNDFSSSSTIYMKPSSFGCHQDFDSPNIPATEISDQHVHSTQKHYGEIHFGSSPFCQNLHEAGSSATIVNQGFEMAPIAQPHMRESGNKSNELLLLPAYGEQSKMLHSNDPRWINRSLGGHRQQNVNSVSLANKSIRDPTTVGNDSCGTQGLSLSLSSVPRTKIPESGFGVGDDSRNIPSKAGSLINDIPAKSLKATWDNMTSTSGLARSSGPLGPFTGYATILKSSKYLKLTQQLLSESCNVGGQGSTETHEVYSQKISEDITISGEAVVRAKVTDSGASSAAFHCSNENSSGSSESYRPEFQQKKAKLLYMLDEICRRYKQHHQQMQMVVSSFESVAGLSSATPYISHAIKAVTRHFRCLKNAISVQLRQTRKALGEDLSSPTTGTSSCKGDTTGTSRLRVSNINGFQKHQKSGKGFFEPQQPVWRPQRGLPERAVSVLRAWLFDHFLHPYPTDTDKHMLATQTGLTRNQVANWFINARVRVWKPMVEEIHTLETKVLEERKSNPGKVVSRPPSEGGNDMKQGELTTSGHLSTNSTSDMRAEWSGNNNTVTLARVGGDELPAAEFWNHEKRPRIECQIPAGGMDGSMLSFEAYQRRGLGGVSLTLGLRQSAEHAQLQMQHQEHQLRQQFGDHIVHEFVG